MTWDGLIDLRPTSSSEFTWTLIAHILCCTSRHLEIVVLCSILSWLSLLYREWGNLAIVSSWHLFLRTSLLYRQWYIVVSLSSYKFIYYGRSGQQRLLERPQCKCNIKGWPRGDLLSPSQAEGAERHCVPGAQAVGGVCGEPEEDAGQRGGRSQQLHAATQPAADQPALEGVPLAWRYPPPKRTQSASAWFKAVGLLYASKPRN